MNDYFNKLSNKVRGEEIKVRISSGVILERPLAERNFKGWIVSAAPCRAARTKQIQQKPDDDNNLLMHQTGMIEEHEDTVDVLNKVFYLGCL